MNVVVIGATAAIAQATTRGFARQGATLHLVGRDRAKLDSVGKDLTAYGAQSVTSTVADLSRIEELGNLWSAIAARHEKIDVVILAHGVLGDEAELRSSIEKTVKLAEVNYLSPIALLTVVAQTFEAQRSGTICVISSVAGDRGRGSNYVYGSTKAGLTAFTDGLRARLSRSGVRVMTVKPGFVATPMTAHLKSGPLVASVDVVGAALYRDIANGGRGWRAFVPGMGDAPYFPWFWVLIMGVIKALPDWIMRKLKF